MCFLFQGNIQVINCYFYHLQLHVPSFMVIRLFPNNAKCHSLWGINRLALSFLSGGCGWYVLCLSWFWLPKSAFLIFCSFIWKFWIRPITKPNQNNTNSCNLLLHRIYPFQITSCALFNKVFISTSLYTILNTEMFINLLMYLRNINYTDLSPLSHLGATQDLVWRIRPNRLENRHIYIYWVVNNLCLIAILCVLFILCVYFFLIKVNYCSKVYKKRCLKFKSKQMLWG